MLKNSVVETGCVEQQLPHDEICVFLNVSFLILQGPLVLRLRSSIYYKTWFPINVLCCDALLLQLLSQVRCWHLSYAV